MESLFGGSSTSNPQQEVVAQLAVQASCATSGSSVVPVYTATIVYSGSTTLALGPSVSAGDRLVWEASGSPADELYTFKDLSTGATESFGEGPVDFNLLLDDTTPYRGFPPFSKTAFSDVRVGGVALAGLPPGDLTAADATNTDGTLIATVSEPVGKQGGTFVVTDARDASRAG